MADGIGAATLKRVSWPVHPAQRGLLESARRGGKGANCAFAYRVNGRLDADRLVAAYRRAIDRCDALRFELDRTDEQPAWTIGPSPRVTIARDDARTWPDLTTWLQGRASVRFDIAVAAGPLGSIDILQTGDTAWVVLEVFDHIIADGRAVGLLHEHVAAEYANAGSTASPGTVAIASYTTLLHAMRDRREQDRAVAFWRHWYRDFEPAPAAARGRGGDLERELSLDPALLAAVERAAGRRGATIPAALFAAHAHAIARHEGRGDVAVFVAVDGRDAETLQVFGQATHLLPVRVIHQWSLSIEAHLSRVARQLLAMREHLQIDVDTLDQCGAPVALAAPTATAFIFHDEPPAPPRFAQLDVEALPLPDLHQTGGLVTVGHREAMGQVRLRIRTPAGSAQHAHLEGVVATIESFLRALITEPTRRLGDDALLPGSMVRVIQAIAEPEPPYAFVPIDRPILRALRHRDAAVVVEDGHVHTVAALRTSIARKLVLLRTLGVQRGEMVVVEDETSFQRIASFLSLLRIGAVYVPADAAAPAMLREEIARRCRAVARFTPSGLTRLTRRSHDREDEHRSPTPTRGARQPSDPAYVIFTSGTTGKPKGVVVSQGALSNLAQGEGTRFGMRAGSRVLLIAPPTVDPWICHVAGGLLAGATLVSATARLSSSLADLLERHGISHAFLPAALFAQLEARPYRELEMIATAGDHCRPDDVRRVLGRRVFNIYGPTESTVTATIAELTAVTEVTTPVPIGRPIRGVGARVVMDGEASVAPGCPGELMLTGAGLALGYLDDEAATADRFRANPFRADDRMYATGDRAYLDARGRLYVVGRLDRQIKIRGFRVELAHLEAEARATGLCGDAHAAAIADEAVGAVDKQLVLYVEGCERPLELLAQLRTTLPAYLMPQAIESLERLPRSPSGKIDESRLPPQRLRTAEGDADSSADAAAAVARSPLAAAWRAVLGAAPRPTDNFFERGGDSLSVLRLVRAARHAGLSLTPHDVYTHAVFGDLAARLEPEMDSPAFEPQANTRARLGPSQQWFFTLALPEPTRWNQQHVMWFARLPDQAALERAFAALLAATPVLRARIDGDGWDCAAMHESSTITTITTIDVPIADATLAAALEAQHAGLDPTRGRVIRAAALRMPDGRGALVVVAHHLVVDDWSWTVIEDRLRRILTGATAIRDDGFARYAGAIRQQLEAGAYGLDAAAWIDRLGSGRTADATRRPKAMSRLTADVQGDPRALAVRWGVPLAPLFLGCVAHALAELEPSGATIVDLERNGRTALAGLDLSQAVGWIALHHPMRLPHLALSRRSVAQLAESLSAAPDMGVGYGALRWSGHAIADGRVGRFAINIAESSARASGEVADLASQLARCGAPAAGTINHLPYEATCTFRSDGGHWRVELTFDPEKLSHSHATALLDAIVRAPEEPEEPAPSARAGRASSSLDPFLAPIPASAMQQLMLTAARTAPGVYRPREVLVFDGLVDRHDEFLAALASGLGRLDPCRRRFRRTFEGIVQLRDPIAPLKIHRRRSGAAGALAWMREADAVDADDVLEGGAVVDVTAFEADGEPLHIGLQIHHAVIDGQGHIALLAWLDDLVTAHITGTDSRIPSLPSSETALRKHVALERACAAPSRSRALRPAVAARASIAPTREETVLTAAEIARVSEWAQRYRVDVRAVFGAVVLVVAFNEGRSEAVYLVTNGRDPDCPEMLEALGQFWYFQPMRPDRADVASLAAQVFLGAGAALRDLRATAHRWQDWLNGRGTAFNFVRHGDRRTATPSRVRVLAQEDLFHFEEQIEVVMRADGSARVARIAWPDRESQARRARLADYLAVLRRATGCDW